MRLFCIKHLLRGTLPFSIEAYSNISYICLSRRRLTQQKKPVLKCKAFTVLHLFDSFCFVSTFEHDADFETSHNNVSECYGIS